jgi:hypothetical protein
MKLGKMASSKYPMTRDNKFVTKTGEMCAEWSTLSPHKGAYQQYHNIYLLERYSSKVTAMLGQPIETEMVILF